jgi:hypothetical protein
MLRRMVKQHSSKHPSKALNEKYLRATQKKMKVKEVKTPPISSTY